MTYNIPDSFYEHFKVLYFICSSMLNETKTLNQKSPIFTYSDKISRMFGNMIYDMPHIWSGFGSKQMILNKLQDRKYQHSPEHHKTRKEGGDAIVKYIQRCYLNNEKLDPYYMFDLIETYCEVHYTTPEENNKLSILTKNGMTSEQAYQQLQIELYLCRDLFIKGPVKPERWKELTLSYYKLFGIEELPSTITSSIIINVAKTDNLIQGE